MAVGYSALVGRSRKKYLTVAAVVLVILILLIVIIYFATKKGDDDHDNIHHNGKMFERKGLNFTNAAVVADSETCSIVGKDILLRNGSAVDAAIAAMFCTSVIHLQSCGIGGGGFMVGYMRNTKTPFTIDFREVAPAAATADMYTKNGTSSTLGPLSTGVPGEVKGLSHAHKMHGVLPWADLLEPSIKLLENGFPINKAMARNIQMSKTKIMNDPGLTELLTDGNGTLLTEGSTLRNPKLATTFKRIQANASDFYHGQLAKDISDDFVNTSGIITEADLNNYKVNLRTPLASMFAGMKVNAMPPPSGGVVVAMLLNILEEIGLDPNHDKEDEIEIENLHKMIEAMKFSYARRGFLGDLSFLPANISEQIDFMLDKANAQKIVHNKFKEDMTFNASYYGGYYGPDDFGTAHVSVLDKDGNAVSVTSSINYWFGSGYRSLKTGIIYNNEMDDFSTPGITNLFGYPPTSANFIEPGKRPLSSMSPLILTDKNGDVASVIGAAGGSKIISAIATVLARTYLMGESLDVAVEAKRIHNQLVPNKSQYEESRPFDAKIISGLEKLGHHVGPTGFISVVQALLKDDHKIFAHSDLRKGGKAAGY